MSRAVPLPYLLVVRWPIGGIRTHLKYAKALAGPDAAPVDPLLVAIDDEDSARLAEQLAITPASNLSRGIRSVRGMAWAAFKACLTQRVKVVHSQGFTSALLAAPGVFLGRQRHIISVHDTVNDGFLAHTSIWVQRALGFVLSRAYAVHAVGKNSAASLRRLPFMRDANNIVLIPNGIDTAQFSQVTPRDWKSELGLASDTMVIGYFGRYMAIKGFRVLVNAIAELVKTRPDLRLQVVSAGEGNFFREDSAYVAELGLSEVFHFIPSVDDPAPLMAGCDVIVMPSLSEAFSLLAVETLCLGVPFIVSDCPGLVEVTAGSPAKRFVSRDAKALAQALLAEHDAPSRALAQAHAPVARAYFDFGPSARQLNALLARAQARRPLAEPAARR